jgi:quinoprotein glucose dehydrogenase
MQATAVLGLGLALGAFGVASEIDAEREWRAYGGGFGYTHFSPLKQIDRSNVATLKQAWSYDTGDAFEGSEMQGTPLVAHGLVYVTTPKLRLVALDAAAGRVLWRFDPHNGAPVKSKSRNRGLMYWESKADGGKSRRLYFAVEEKFYSIDALTGKPDPAFGQAVKGSAKKTGFINLKAGLGRNVANTPVTVTTPSAVYGDTLILGSLNSEGLPAAPGDIRAYNARTGAQLWAFHTIPYPNEPGAETYPKNAREYLGAANSWAGMTLDEKRGILFVPTGSTAFDFYGANRAGDNLYANCLLALDAKTGRRIWHFQMIRHDLWDRDLPAPPSLVTVRRDGKEIDAVAQTTKSGHVYVFERETGKPLFGIEEVPVPQEGVDGEVPAKSEPLPISPPPFTRQKIDESDLTQRTPEAHQDALERYRKLKKGSQFMPPSLEGTLIMPGFDGGAEWGGSTWDPEARLLYVNANEMPSIIRLIPRSEAAEKSTGRTLYLRNCASCHRPDLSGSGNEVPALKSIASRRKFDDVLKVIRGGSARMPGFGGLGESAVNAIARYLMTGEAKEATAARQDPRLSLKYTLDGYVWFQDAQGYPAVQPPWGTLTAINLDDGSFAWRKPFGEYPELVAKGMANTGTQNYGGSVATAGGLLFIGATIFDNKLHAYDKRTGALLWETVLPAAAASSPAVYEAGGKEFVLIGAGGGKFGGKSGGSYHAFALP